MKVLLGDEFEAAAVLVRDSLEELLVRLTAIHERDGIDLYLIALVQLAQCGEDLLVVREVATGTRRD